MRKILVLLLAVLTPLLLSATVVQYRPTTYTPTCDPNCGGMGYFNPALAYDNNSVTNSSATVSNADVTYEQETWSGFPSGSGATPIKLKITSRAEAIGAHGATARLMYSLDNGSTWITIYGIRSSGGDTVRNKTTDVVTLSNTQDLTQVMVQGQASAALGAGSANSEIYEIWIEEGN